MKLIGHLIPPTARCGFGRARKIQCISFLLHEHYSLAFATENCRCSTRRVFLSTAWASSVHWPCSVLKHSVLPQHPATGISVQGTYSPSRSSCSLNGNASLG